MLKSTITFIFLLCLPILTFSQNSKMEKPSKDVVAIKDVIKSETAAFWERDYKAWSDSWIQESHIVWTAATQDGVRQYKGWDDWSAEVRRFIKENPKPDKDNILRADWVIRVYGTGAWASFIQDWNGSISKETRILEKQDGTWKIAFVETLYNLKKNPKKMETEKKTMKKEKMNNMKVKQKKE